MGQSSTSGSLTVTASTFSGNSTASGLGSGGAIFNRVDGTVTVTASTFSANNATFGGAIINSGDILTVTANTFSGNNAVRGGALDNIAGTLILQSTILANSTGGNCVNVAPGITTSNGYNLSDDASCNLTASGDIPESTSVNLGPLTDNGGPTATMLPLAGSDAIEAIPPAECATLSSPTDQRGVARPQGINCEVGAVEMVIGAVTLCANRYTGALTAATGAGCPPGSVVLSLPSANAETLCINRYTGGLVWASRGTCAPTSLVHVVPDDGPLSFCQNIYTSKLRYTATGSCSPSERAGVIPGVDA